MTKHFTDNEFEKLFRFIGYGTLEAEYWFIGMEEAGGGEENLINRIGFDPVEDCKEAHEKLKITKHHTGKKIIQRTWRGMCCIMLTIEGKEITTENVREYQANSLGRKNGNTLLCELMPLPKPGIGDWEYTSLFPQFNSVEEYYSLIKPQRIAYLKSVISKCKPKFVTCYGKKYWEDYKKLFPKHHFEERDIFSISKSSSNTVILTDHFTARSMNGQFQNVANILTNC